MTYKSLGRSVSLEYTEGYWKGILGKDKLSIAGLPKSAQVEFAGIMTSKKFFQAAADWQGILGLGYPALAKVCESCFFFRPVFNIEFCWLKCGIVLTAYR